MKTNPGITALLRHARLLAIEEFAATTATVGEFRAYLKDVVIRQVLAGLWRDHGVTKLEQIAGLDVRVERGNPLLGEPPLKLDWNFTKTALPTLVVENA